MLINMSLQLCSAVAKLSSLISLIIRSNLLLSANIFNQNLVLELLLFIEYIDPLHYVWF